MNADFFIELAFVLEGASTSQIGPDDVGGFRERVKFFSAMIRGIRINPC